MPKRVTAIVPAYNEGPRLASVLDALTTYPGFLEVIVVDDGSTDNTASVARRYNNVRLVKHLRNQGKGRSLDDGVHAAKGEIIFFADADIRGLSHHIITQTLEPVLQGSVSMMIAILNRKIYLSGFLLRFIPLVSGQRALTRQLWNIVPTRYKHRFMIEPALNFYAKHYAGGFSYQLFSSLKQTVKEKKYGFWSGFPARLAMLSEIFRTIIQLQITEAPAPLYSGRISLLYALASLTGLAIGVAFFLV